MPDAWVRPTSHNDVSSGWNDEALAYDTSTGTYAYSNDIFWGGEAFPPSGELEFFHDAISCNKIRVWLGETPNNYGETFFRVHCFYSGVWNDLGTVYTYGEYIEKAIGSTQVVTGIKLQFLMYDEAQSPSSGRIYDVAFWEVSAGPSIPVVMHHYKMLRN